MASANNKTYAALQVPILPHTSPEAEQPENFRLPLYRHQLRALSRCQLIENETSNNGDLAGDFGQRWDYKSRGGCLADQVGTGKTATMLALILSGEKLGDTLIVAPTHLINQWQQEIQKFCQPEAVQVIVGKQQYSHICSRSPPPGDKHRIVLVDVDTILKEERLWYDFRRVFSDRGGHQIRISDALMQVYRKAANFCVKSPKGPCSYDGYVYTGCLHIPKYPWHRVVLDEIQDLVQEGAESQKCLLQLTRTAKYVWLLSATPFPHGNQSVFANNQLLGFQRLRMDVEVDYTLPEDHTFEKIKRKLYIRSPPHVADEAVSTTVTRNTEYVNPLALEKQFYKLEQNNMNQLISNDPIDSDSNIFGEAYRKLREMTVHPEASPAFRQMMGSNGNEYTAPVSVSVKGAANRAIRESKLRLEQLVVSRELMQDLENTKRSLTVAEKVQKFRTNTPFQESVFSGIISPETLRVRKQMEHKLIHDEYCYCSYINGSGCVANKHVQFRVIRDSDDFISPEFLSSLHEVTRYFDTELAEGKEVARGNGAMLAINNYISVTKRTYEIRKDNIKSIETERKRLQERIEVLSATNNVASEDEDQLAKTHGSKPAALVRFLKARPGERVIIFSYWHDTLKLVHRTLQKNKLISVFCEGAGRHMVKALEDFTLGRVPILLLSAQSKASGANLQCASNVILLDPAGSSAEHGSTLEEQAIGRAVRMGQNQPVTVTRFCSRGTLEEQLFEEIDRATENRKRRASNLQYTIQDACRTAPKAVKEDKKNDGEVEVTASFTQADILKKSLQKAIEDGNVIDLLESDNEDTTGSKKESEGTQPYLTALGIKRDDDSEPQTRAFLKDPNAAQKTNDKDEDTSCTDENTSHSSKKRKHDDTSGNSTKVVNEVSIKESLEQQLCSNDSSDILSLPVEQLCLSTGKVLKSFATGEEARLSVTNSIQKLTFKKVLQGQGRSSVDPHYFKGFVWRLKGSDYTPILLKYDMEIIKKYKLENGINRTKDQCSLKRGLESDQSTSPPPTRIRTREETDAVVTPDLSKTGENNHTTAVTSIDRRVTIEDDNFEGGKLAKTKSLKDFLDLLDLNEYYVRFVENGHVDLSLLCDKHDDMIYLERLVENVKFKPGHAIRFYSNLFKEANNK